GYRMRHPGGVVEPQLQSGFHDPREGHGAGPCGGVKDGRGARRDHRCGKRAGAGERFHASSTVGRRGLDSKARASVLVIDDDNLMRDYVQESLERAGFAVEAANSGQAGIDALAAGHFDAVVTDLKMSPVDGLEVVRRAAEVNPKTAIVVMTAYGTIETAVAAMKAGAGDYVLKPFPQDALEWAVERGLERVRLAEESRYLRETDNARYDCAGFVGESAEMRALYEQVKRVARTRSTVFVRGESGTVKELVARAIHQWSD